MKRILLAATFATAMCFFLPAWIVDVSAQDCDSCAIAHSFSTSWSGTLDVCFQSGQFTSDQRSWYETGINSYWGAWFEGNDVDISFYFRESSDCSGTNVYIRRDNALIGTTTGAEASPTHGITVNPDVLDPGMGMNDDENFHKWEGAHEMGHVLGFDHTAGGDSCAAGSSSLSIMVPHHPSNDTFPSTIGCGDAHGASSYYLSTSGYNDDQWEHSGASEYEDCWDHWRYVYVVWKDSEGFTHSLLVDTIYMGWTCTPPI
jgi:hypothetical protein